MWENIVPFLITLSTSIYLLLLPVSHLSLWESGAWQQGLTPPWLLVSQLPSLEARLGHHSLPQILQIPFIMSGLLFQECGILLEGSTGIFSKGHLRHSPFSYMIFRACFFTNMFDSIGTLYCRWTEPLSNYSYWLHGNRFRWHLCCACGILKLLSSN